MHLEREREQRTNICKLYNKDCLEILKNIPNESIDLIVTDCPYHIVQGGCSNNSVTFKAMSGVLNKQRNYEGVNKEDIKKSKIFKHNDIEFSEWLPELYRTLKDDSHCYIMINGRNLKELQIVAEKVGFKYLNLLVWDKQTQTPNRWYMNAVEFILMLRKGKAVPINDMGSKNVIRVPNIKKGTKQHPTEKPVELMEILINNSSQENDLVLDCFMGSGSTGIACLNTNRTFIGMELDENYFNIAKERIEKRENELEELRKE